MCVGSYNLFLLCALDCFFFFWVSLGSRPILFFLIFARLDDHTRTVH